MHMNYEEAYNFLMTKIIAIQDNPGIAIKRSNLDTEDIKSIVRDISKYIVSKKNENEYIRLKIEQLIRLNTSGAEKTHLLAWLEKQVGQNPTGWTIENALPGEILSTGYVIFLFKTIDDNSVYMYCCYNLMDDTFEMSDTAVVDPKYVHPATESEREILLEKIKQHLS